MIANENKLPEPRTRIEHYLNAMAEGNTQGEPFVVGMTITGTGGGVMDKTNIEILDAYTKGKTILFQIDLDGITCRVEATLGAQFTGYEYPSFNALGLGADGNTLMSIFVDPSDEESSTFSLVTKKIQRPTAFQYLFISDDGTGPSGNLHHYEIEDALDRGDYLFLDYTVLHGGFTIGIEVIPTYRKDPHDGSYVLTGFGVNPTVGALVYVTFAVATDDQILNYSYKVYKLTDDIPPSM